jgi:hypothetical protein
MENKKVIGHSGILILGMLLMVVAVAGADDKKKTTSSPPPPPRPAPQVSRPAPQVHTATPMQHPTNTNTYHPPNNTYHPQSNTYHPQNNTNHQVTTGTPVNKGTGNVYRQGNTTSTGRTVTPTVKTPANTVAPHTSGLVRGPVNTPHSTVASSHPVFHEAPRTTRDFGDKHVAYDRGGRVRDVRAPGMVVHHDLRGGRTFVAERNGRRIVSMGPHRGYMQHAYLNRGGRVYVQRTYVVGGVRYARVYRSYSWNGGIYYHYVPGFYYRPAFYGWAYNPWPVRVSWGWGWGGAPWYGYYGYYFAPYPVYPSASFWLTDYLLAENLKLAYAAQQDNGGGAPPDAGPPPDNTVQLSPEVKQMIADEVQRQLAAEQGASGNPAPQSAPPPQQGSTPQETPSSLDANSRVFVVSSNLDVVKEDGSECSLSPGDVIIRTSATPDGTKVSVNVITSKKADCPSNTNTAVEVNDLQEMQNQFREQLDAGLKTLADNQGKNGLPSAPDTATTGGEVPPPAPDASAEADLQQQQKSADQTEANVPKAAPGGQQ